MHGTLTWAGRKSLVICATHLAGGFFVEKAKNFDDILNIFEFLRVWENVESCWSMQISFFELPNQISWLKW